MARTKINPSGSLLPRLSGSTGHGKVIDILKSSTLVSGNEAIAEELSKAGQIIEVDKETRIITQDDTDNDIYIIISGAFDILVNSRVIASRHQGQNVGEMALVDSVARRSATVEATEKSILLKITEECFIRIANNYPEIWRRLAIELSSRLRQRNGLIRQPRTQPVIFIASSSEGLPIAQKIKTHFDNDPFIINIWSDGVFKPTSTAIEDLVKAIHNSDFAIIVITPDDIVISRSVKASTPRDNVLFEFGLFIGHLGRERSFFIHERGIDIKIPSDLFGVNGIIYNSGPPNTFNRRLTNCTKIIRKRVIELGPI